MLQCSSQLAQLLAQAPIIQRQVSSHLAAARGPHDKLRELHVPASAGRGVWAVGGAARAIWGRCVCRNSAEPAMHGPQRLPAGRAWLKRAIGQQRIALIGIAGDRAVGGQQEAHGARQGSMSGSLAQRQQLAGLGGLQARTSRQPRTQAAAGRPGRCRLACAAAGEGSRCWEGRAWRGMCTSFSLQPGGGAAFPRAVHQAPLPPLPPPPPACRLLGWRATACAPCSPCDGPRRQS